MSTPEDVRRFELERLWRSGAASEDAVLEVLNRGEDSEWKREVNKKLAPLIVKSWTRPV